MAPPDTGSNTTNIISVDGPGMDKAASDLESIHTEHLHPNLLQAGKGYQLGTPFGRSTVSPALVQARTTHQYCLTDAVSTINQVMLTADLLVAAIREIRQNYTNADLNAASNSGAIDTILGNALAQAQAQVDSDGTVATTPAAESTRDAEG